MNATVEMNAKEQFLASIAKGEVQELGIRSTALSALEQLDFPTRKTEAWKYTRTTPISNASWNLSHNAETLNVDQFRIEGIEHVLVFVNGYYNESLSSAQVEGLQVQSIGEAASVLGEYADHKNELFVALNTAYNTGGVALEIAANAVLKESVQLLHISTGDQVLAQPRHVILSNKSSQAHFVQTFNTIGQGTTFTNVVLEAVVQENASLTIDKVQFEEGESHHVSTDQVYQQRDSRFTINTLTLNGQWVRNNLNIIVNGENCETNLNGLYLLTGKQHVDNHTMVDHKVPNCESNELYKGILDDKSTGVFNGKVFVRPDAQKTNAFQSNGNILLSDDATMNSKPELEIYADDVKCSHGSTTGQFDEEAVFYLRARGIGEDSARKLLVAAFAGEVLDNIDNEAVTNHVEQLLEQRFGWEF